MTSFSVLFNLKIIKANICTIFKENNNTLTHFVKSILWEQNYIFIYLASIYTIFLK